MKTLISTLFIAFFSMNVQAQVELAALNASTDRPQDAQVYQSFYEALLSGDMDKARAFLHEDFSIFGMEETPLNAEAYLNVWQGYYDGAHDLKMQGAIQPIQTELEDMEGNWVGSWFEASWTENQNAKTFQAWHHQMARLQDGKISLIYHFENPLPYLLESGYQLIPPTGEER